MRKCWRQWASGPELWGSRERGARCGCQMGSHGRRHRNKCRGMVISTVTARRWGCVVDSFSKNDSKGIMPCRTTMLPTTGVGGGIWQSCANRSCKPLLLRGLLRASAGRPLGTHGTHCLDKGLPRARRQTDQSYSETHRFSTPTPPSATNRVAKAGFKAPAALCTPCDSSCRSAALRAWSCQPAPYAWRAPGCLTLSRSSPDNGRNAPEQRMPGLRTVIIPLVRSLFDSCRAGT